MNIITESSQDHTADNFLTFPAKPWVERREETAKPGSCCKPCMGLLTCPQTHSLELLSTWEWLGEFTEKKPGKFVDLDLLTGSGWNLEALDYSGLLLAVPQVWICAGDMVMAVLSFQLGAPPSSYLLSTAPTMACFLCFHYWSISYLPHSQLDTKHPCFVLFSKSGHPFLGGTLSLSESSLGSCWYQTNLPRAG